LGSTFIAKIHEVHLITKKDHDATIFEDKTGVTITPPLAYGEIALLSVVGECEEVE
jgi:hypothetical protein